MAKKWTPVEPVNKKLFLQYKLSIDPKDIPKTKKNKSILKDKIEQIEKDKQAAIDAAIKAVEDAAIIKPT